MKRRMSHQEFEVALNKAIDLLQVHKEVNFFGDSRTHLEAKNRLEAIYAASSKRYKELANKYHPDKGGDPEKMLELNEAIEMIQIFDRLLPSRLLPPPLPVIQVQVSFNGITTDTTTTSSTATTGFDAFNPFGGGWTVWRK